MSSFSSIRAHHCVRISYKGFPTNFVICSALGTISGTAAASLFYFFSTGIQISQ